MYTAAVVPVVMCSCHSILALVGCLDWVFVSAMQNNKIFQLLHFLSGQNSFQV